MCGMAFKQKSKSPKTPQHRNPHHGVLGQPFSRKKKTYNNHSPATMSSVTPKGPPRPLSGTPWIPSYKTYTSGIIGLHQEIEDFYTWMAPQEFEYAMRRDVVGRVGEVIRRRYPDAVVKCFGSFCTGLFLPNSDIDMVAIGKWRDFPLFTLKQEMVTAGVCFEKDIKILDKASVPILKIMDKLNGVKFNMVNGVNGSKFISDCIARYPVLPKLVLVLKQFLHCRDLNEVYTGGISSYCLILLTISFLQLHPRYFPTDREENLGVLLMEFFELYGHVFNYGTTAIRVRNGGSYIKKDAIKRQLPAGQSPGLLSIEDPIVPEQDAGRSSFGALDVRNAFEYAYLQLSRAVMSYEYTGGSFLNRILHVSDAMVKYREVVRRRWEDAL